MAGQPTVSPHALPVSNVSMSDFDTQYYLIRGLPFSMGQSLDMPLGATDSPAIPNSLCPITSCSVPPGQFCRGLRCPPLHLPSRQGCVAVQKDGSLQMNPEAFRMVADN